MEQAKRDGATLENSEWAEVCPRLPGQFKRRHEIVYGDLAEFKIQQGHRRAIAAPALLDKARWSSSNCIEPADSCGQSIETVLDALGFGVAKKLPHRRIPGRTFQPRDDLGSAFLESEGLKATAAVECRSKGGSQEVDLVHRLVYLEASQTENLHALVLGERCVRFESRCRPGISRAGLLDRRAVAMTPRPSEDVQRRRRCKSRKAACPCSDGEGVGLEVGRQKGGLKMREAHPPVTHSTRKIPRSRPPGGRRRL